MICSLLGFAWLAAGQAAADPAPLHPLVAPPQADLRDPPPLMPIMKSTLPEVKPAGAKTLYYQKDATKPPAVTGMAVVYQDPAIGQATPSVPTLPTGALTTEPPSIADIGTYSDAELKRVITAEVDNQYKNQRDNIYKMFPVTYYNDPRTKVPYAPRVFAPSALRVEPMYVCYGRLFFEDKNTERYGWQLGPLQPLFSAAKFYSDLLAFPYNYGTRPCQRYEADAGYCLPGDPVPYLLYPVELSLTGGLLEAGTAVGLAAILP